MAEYLASIFGTEKDKVNCSFFFKIGACTHGERCSRIHNKPTFSQTILLQNLYINPQNSAKTADGSHLANVTDEEMQARLLFYFRIVSSGEYLVLTSVILMRERLELNVLNILEANPLQEHYDNFFEDVFVECEDKYGPVEEMNVCDNLGDHLVGNVYVKFKKEEDADKAVKDLNNRWFGGRPIYAELTPVTDFREACCRQYETGECTRSGFCNFMHLKPISRKLRSELYGRNSRRGPDPARSGLGDLKDEIEQERAKRRERSRDRDRRRDRRDRSRSRDRDRRRDRSRERRRDRENGRSFKEERGGGGEDEDRSGGRY